MGFLIRCVFWLSLVLLIIPLDTGATKSDQPSVGPIQAFFAAREAVQDMAGICTREPEVCTTGRAALHTITARAREGVRIASEMIGDEAEPATTAQATPERTAQAAPDRTLTTGTIAVPTPRPETH
ncbi:MAG TPA: DUF5330 domain-containing protein [Burkholderiales bacterium]|nr:DUF5330 domain-containing protein [Burkholderiales bacterium]